MKTKLSFTLEENKERTEIQKEVKEYVRVTEEYIKELKKANQNKEDLNQKVRAILAESDMLNQKAKLEKVFNKYPRVEIEEIE